MTTLFESNEADLRLISRGKVRDIYELDDDTLLIVASDRLSAFDVILPTPIPGKGEVLTQISELLVREDDAGSSPTTSSTPSRSPATRPRRTCRAARWRCASARRCRSRRSCAATSPARAARTTWAAARSAASGCPRACSSRRGCPSRSSPRRPRPRSATTTRTSASSRRPRSWAPETAAKVRDASLALYTFAADYARERGIIIADTKFEFGLRDGELILIDEVLTPDSSRFWPADLYEPGRRPAQLRQAVRARLPGDAGLGQDRSRPRAAARHRRQDGGQVPRSPAADHRQVTWAARASGSRC